MLKRRRYPMKNTNMSSRSSATPPQSLESIVREKNERNVSAITMLEDELQMWRSFMHEHVAETHDGVRRRILRIESTLMILKELNHIEISERYEKTMKTLIGIIGATLIIGAIVLFFVAFALSNTPSAPVGTVVIVALIALIVGIIWIDRPRERLSEL